MTDRPILFGGPMVLALLDGRKTQTRRLATSPFAKCRPGDRLWVRERALVTVVEAMPEIGIRFDADDTSSVVPFPVDRMKQIPIPGKRLSMGCYREASRLTLLVTEVRYQRLQDISEADAFAEGLDRLDQTLRSGVAVPLERPLAGNDGWGSNDHNSYSQHGWDYPRMVYADLWESLHGTSGTGGTNGDHCWEANPGIVALTFTVHRCNIDAMPALVAA